MFPQAELKDLKKEAEAEVKKSKKKKGAVAPAAPAAAPAEAPAPPGLAGMGRQLVMLPAMWASHKVDWTQPTAQSALLAVFGVVVLVGFAMVQYTLKQIYKAKPTGRVEDPGEGAYFPTKAADGTISELEYDVAKVKELKTQFMMSVGMVTFLHIKWGYTQPILIMCLMQPMQFWGMQARTPHPAYGGGREATCDARRDASSRRSEC